MKSFPANPENECISPGQDVGSRATLEVGFSSLSDVARVSNASPATVSRVLNGHPHVSKSTRNRVLQVVQQLNYRPSAYGRSLRSGKRKMIGLLRSPDTAMDELYNEVIVNNLVRYLTVEGYGAAAEFISQSKDGVLLLPDVVHSKRVDGVIMVGHLDESRLKQVATWGLPVCLVNNRYDHPGFFSCSLDDYAGSREAVQYLAALGRRQIAFVHGNIEWPSTAARHRGYLEAMRELGLKVKPEHVVKVDDNQQNYQGGYLATKQLLNRAPDLDAIYYVNDWYAVGGICALQSMGKRIPEDVSIIGYDNSWMAAQVLPALTTVSLQPEDICQRAIALLVRAVEGRSLASPNELVRPRLIVRESCAARQSVHPIVSAAPSSTLPAASDK